MYRIRFHGRGGQGLKTASRVLGTALFREGYEVQDAPRYGAERRGAPIFAYVRAAHAPIHERGIIRRPDLVVVADDSIVPVPVAGVLAGLDEHTVLLIASSEPAETWRERLNLPGKILTLDVSEGEIEGTGQFVAVRSAAAAACLIGVVSRAALEKAIAEELAPLGPDVVENSRSAALEAYDLMSGQKGLVGEGTAHEAKDYALPRWIVLTSEDTSRSAPIIHGEATSVEVRTGLWRTLRPVIDLSHCTRCGLCNAYCPDSTIDLDDEGWPHVDYEHCKGCMVCVAQCPTHTIAAIPEAAAEKDKAEAEAAEGRAS